MVAYSILLNLLILIGVGCIVAILVALIMVNLKLSKLIHNMAELNRNICDAKRGNLAHTSNELRAASFKEEQSLQKNEKVGVVFCRKCASHFTSDKDTCPKCGTRR